MVPHALFVPSDRSVDLVLQLLTLVVVAALLVSFAAFVYSWLYPTPRVKDRGDVGPPAWAAMSDVLLSPPRIELETKLSTLPALLTVYRCEHHGDVTYSDRPCPRGQVRALKLRPS